MILFQTIMYSCYSVCVCKHHITNNNKRKRVYHVHMDVICFVNFFSRVEKRKGHFLSENQVRLLSCSCEAELNTNVRAWEKRKESEEAHMKSDPKRSHPRPIFSKTRE